MIRLASTLVAAVMLAGVASPARAANRVTQRAAQIAGLFMQSCVQYAGNPTALRAWAGRKKLVMAQQAEADDFLDGLPGVVFDASNAWGKFVLVSEDSGSCSVIAERTSGKALLHQLDADLKQAGVSYQITADGPDPQEQDLHNRAYRASLDTRHWQMLVSTVNDKLGGEAMLTTTP